MNLVFASGVLVPQKIAGLDYFRGLPAVYPEALFFPVSKVKGVEARAQELAGAIATKFPTGEIHIVAHSMGGLDSRCLLAKNLEGLANPGRVVSLSTISTPHHGSPLAELAVRKVPLLGFTLENLLSEFGDFDAVADLATSGAPGFKEKDPVPHIHYYAYSGTGVGSKVLWALHKYIETVEGPNDGIVSTTSATWPDHLEEPVWAADHLAEIGYDLNHPDLKTSFDYQGAIARVIQRAAG